MTTPASSTETPSLFFADARECKAWLGGLPMTNAAQSQAALLDALRVFNRAAFDPLERLKCLELIRERNASMLAELRLRHLSKPLPVTPADLAAWTTALGGLEEIEAGYRRCAAEGDLAGHATLISQRIVRTIAAQMVLHAVAYRPFDATLWTRLHQQYAAAEKAGIAEERVKDSLESEVGSSLMEAYARAVLLHAAGPHEMSPPKVAFTEALLRGFMRKVRILARPPAQDAPAVFPMVVDLAQPRGAEAAPGESLLSTQRIIDVEELSRSLRRRIRALQAGEDIATLGLPAEASAVDPLQALQRLTKRWCEPAARPAPGGVPTHATAGLVHGLPDIHFFLSGGKVFEQPGTERELSRQEKEDIAVFGRVTERTQSFMAAANRSQAGIPTTGHALTVEPWDVLEESLGSLRLRRRPTATKSVAVGRLVALRLGDSAPLMVGVIRSLWNEEQGLTITVATFPGRPEPIAVRGTNPAWSQGLALPALEKAGVPRSFIVPSAVAFRGRAIHLWQEGATAAKVLDVLERGADFDRITLA